MFKSISLYGAKSAAASTFKSPSGARPLSYTFALYKQKNKKSGGSKGKDRGAVKEDTDLAVEDPSHVLPNLEAKYKECLEQHRKKVTETKLGAANPKVFDKLEVEINKKPQIFTSLAQTALKGRNLIITVFDPNNSKHIVSSVLGSGLNMNPETVPNFPQQLKVPLPPPTAESRQEIAKQLKADFEKFKNSSDKHSLSTARASAMKELKTFEKTDTIKKISNDVEKLHKKYADELQTQFKAAEKSVVK